jgi:uncharacterized oxidoreductase
VYKSEQELDRLTIQILQAAGVEAAVAKRTARHLVNSNLMRMDSHGVMRLPDYVAWLERGVIAREDRIEVLDARGATALLDGHSTFGPVVAGRAAELAIGNARQFGIGLAAARNSAHIGRLGEYVEDIARQGFIGYICSNAQGAGQLVAPWGGRTPRLSTNPLAWGIPTGGDPIVIDMATSATAEGKVRVKLRRGETIPAGWAINAEGAEVTNPADFYGPPMGALVAAAGHKGYGLALVVEALAGALTAGGIVEPKDFVDWPLCSFVIIAIDAGLFRPLAEFEKTLDNLVAYVKSSTPINPAAPVLTPGEPEQRARQEQSANGIFIEDETWRQIQATARSLNVQIDAA